MKLFKLIILIIFANIGFAQTFYNVTTLSKENGNIVARNPTNKIIFMVNCHDLIWYENQDASIGIWDYQQTTTNRLIVRSSVLVSPTFANLLDSLEVWKCASNSIPLDTSSVDTSLFQHIQLQQIIDTLSVINTNLQYIYKLDTTQQDTALDKTILDNDFDSVLVLNDSISVYLNNDSIFATILNDSIKVYFTQPIEVKDTTHEFILSEINTILNTINQRIDTTQQDTSFINYINEWNRNNDTLSAILQEIKKVDSVYVVNRDTAIVKVVGMKDTLYTYDLDTSVVYAIDSTYYTQLDSIITLLKDTIDFEYNTICYRSKADSGVYQFSVVFDVKTPNIPYYMSFFDVDSLYNLYEFVNGVPIGTPPNFVTDYVPCEKWHEYLNSIDTIKDTLKALVFKAQTKRIDGTLDTLYNCKGISFNVSANATGNITFYYGDGDQDVYDVASEDLPHWENGSFVEFLGFDASGVSGVVRINMLGCNQTSDVICAKEKPIINCTTTAPIIICSGWGSLSGIWSTISGCWNTGQ